MKTTRHLAWFTSIAAIAAALSLTTTSHASITSWSMNYTETAHAQNYTTSFVEYNLNASQPFGLGNMQNDSQGVHGYINADQFIADPTVTSTSTLLQIANGSSSVFAQVGTPYPVNLQVENLITLNFSLSTTGALSLTLGIGSPSNFGPNGSESASARLDGNLLSSFTGVYSGVTALSIGAHTLTFDALASTSGTANSFRGIGTGSVNFSITTVPEPSSLLVLGLGGALVLVHRKRTPTK